MEKTEILLEAGTNEIEIMKFNICGDTYGINVAKVREIILSEPLKPMPGAHEMVEGIFKPRNKVLAVIDLPRYITGEKQEKHEKDLFLITYFNKMDIAFRVDEVLGIERLSWTQVKPIDKTLHNGETGMATGIAEIGDDFVVVLDFERIVADIIKEVTLDVDSVKTVKSEEREKYTLLIAEDSELLAKLMLEALDKSGYTNYIRFNNGQELWEYLNTIEEDEIETKANLIITDIEMPQMDGHHLTKLVKTSTKYKHIPLVIFSSILSDEMKKKGEELGADEQLTKPEIVNLVGLIEKLLTFWDN